MSWRTFLKAHWGAIADAAVGRIRRRERLGGLLTCAGAIRSMEHAVFKEFAVALVT
jgi:hypothetical protein